MRCDSTPARITHHLRESCCRCNAGQELINDAGAHLDGGPIDANEDAAVRWTSPNELYGFVEPKKLVVRSRRHHHHIIRLGSCKSRADRWQATRLVAAWINMVRRNVVFFWMACGG